MDKEIAYLNKKVRTAKCALCPKGCIRDAAVTNMCTDKIGLNVEAIAQNAFDANLSATDMYYEYKAMEKVSQGGKFEIRKHLKKLRAQKQEKALNKMIEYLEQKAQLNPKNSNDPLQLILIDADANKYKHTNLLISADCAPFVYPDFEKRFSNLEQDMALILFCPQKKTANAAYVEKLAYIFENNDIKSVLVMQTETPCCSEMKTIVKKALKKARRIMPTADYKVSISGEIT